MSAVRSWSGALVIAVMTGPCMGTASADGGASIPVEAGTRVRVMLEGAGPLREVAGRLIASDPRTLTVASADGAVVVPRDGVVTVLYRTRERDRRKGAIIGGAITGVAGLIAGIVLVARESEGSCEQCGIAVGMAAVAGAIPGAGIGYAIGTPREAWHPVEPGALKVIDDRPARR